MPYAASGILCPIVPSSSSAADDVAAAFATGPLILTLLALLAFAAIGAIAGVLAGLLGIGGGAVIVPALIWLFGHGELTSWNGEAAVIPHQAVATSLATVVATGLASTRAHNRRGAVDWRLFRHLAIGLLLGAWAGAFAAAWLPALWLQRLFALFLLYNGLRMIARPNLQPRQAPPGRIGLTGAATGFGALSAMLGIGGGVLVVPFLARRGVDMRRAVATASACGVPLALAGSIGFLIAGWGEPGLAAQSLGFIYWPAALAIMATSVPLAPLGAWLAHRLPTAWVKRVFGMLLLVVSVELGLG